MNLHRNRNHNRNRRQMLHAGLALGLGLALPAAKACEFFTTTLRVTHPWTRASDDADVAIVCMKFDEVRIADRLIGAETALARSAELGGPGVIRRLELAIPQGEETLLSEEGIHLRLVGLTQPIELGRAYPMRLIFERGGAIDVDLSVDFEHLRDHAHDPLPAN
jgi:periplasmic copper chaperone A